MKFDERLRRIKEKKLREEREREAERIISLPFNQQNAINATSIGPNQTLQSIPQQTTSTNFSSSPSLSSSSPSSSSSQIPSDDNHIDNAFPSSSPSLSHPFSKLSISPSSTNTPTFTNQILYPVSSSSLRFPVPKLSAIPSRIE